MQLCDKFDSIPQYPHSQTATAWSTILQHINLEYNIYRATTYFPDVPVLESMAKTKVFLTWLTITLFAGCALIEMTTASSLRRLVSTVYNSGSEFHRSGEPTMMTTTSNPIRFHASAVKGSRKINPRDSSFPTEVVEKTAYLRFGSIFPSITGTVAVSYGCGSWLLVLVDLLMNPRRYRNVKATKKKSAAIKIKTWLRNRSPDFIAVYNVEFCRETLRGVHYNNSNEVESVKFLNLR